MRKYKRLAAFLLGAGGLVLVFGLLYLIVFYRDVPVVRWLWWLLWLVGLPALIAWATLIAQRKDEPRNHK